jgi:opacity protein-like surface antigen
LPAIGEETAPAGNSVDSLFQKERYEAGISSGVLFSPILADKGRPTVDYTLSGVHFGWMLTDVNESSCLPGNWELLGEAIGGTTFCGRGNYLAGGTAWVRYNFVEPNWRLLPYVQGGGGAELTDFDQRLIGEHFNFNLDLAAGVHYFVKPNLSLNLEARYQHLSNAKFARTDIGINAFGPMLGVSYFF